MNGWVSERLAIVAALSVLLTAACSSAPEPSGAPSAGAAGYLAVGDLAPDFTLPTAEGGMASLSDYRGRPVLLYFSMGPG